MKEKTNQSLKEMIVLSKEMSRLTKQALENSLSKFPDSHFAALERLYMAIAESGEQGCISASLLAQDLCMAPSALSRELRTLESAGFIIRRLDPTDRRKTLISITDTGEKHRSECESAVISYFSSVAYDVGDDDIQDLCRIHRKITNSLMRRNARWQSDSATEALRG
jgi:DNA-binding MarR family transcriptional regulator